MTTERWTRLSEWHNAWLAADAVERECLRSRLAVEHSELVREAEELAAASADSTGFLDEALQELSRAVEVRDPALTFCGVDPRWDGLRTRPAFRALLSRVNLLEVSNRVLADSADSDEP